MKNNKKKISTDSIFAAAVVILLIAAAAFNIFSRDREMSEKENRQLASFPELSVSTIFDGSFMDNFESYAADQFVWRDIAVSCKAELERLLGKTENNGVYLCRDNYLIAKPADFDKETVDNNLNAIRQLRAAGDYNLTVAIVPTAFEVLSDKLPKNAYDNRINMIMDEVWTQLDNSDVDICDTRDALKSHKDEYIYYRTDHHQTALGSYYVYDALKDYLGYETSQHDTYKKVELTESFYGTSWSNASLISAKPDIIEKYIPSNGNCRTITEFPNENKSIEGMYFTDRLVQKDKYSVYLDGNHALTKIRAYNESGRKLAIIKDSYAHSLAPFLAADFEEITLIDLRYYDGDVAGYLKKNKISDVLVLYDAETFNTDKNLVQAGQLAEDLYGHYGYVEETEPVGDGYFEDTVFFGDSLTEGHRMNSSLPAHFVCATAVNTETINISEASSGASLTEQLLAMDNVNKYYLMLGINEIHYKSIDGYIERYGELIDKIKAANPDAVIYIQSVVTVEESYEGNPVKKEQIETANDRLLELAISKECYYLDVNSALAQPNGYLPEGSANDGIHFGKDLHDKWDAYLKSHALSAEGGVVYNTQSLYTGGGTVDIDGFVNDMLSSIAFKDKLNATEQTVIRRILDIEPGILLNGALYTGGGATAEEFAVFETTSAETAADIKQKLLQRIEERKSGFKTYKPEEMTKLNSPVIEVHGNVVMMCISDDNDSAIDIISRY